MKKLKLLFKATINLFVSIILIFLIYSCRSEKENSGEVNSGTPVQITYPSIIKLNDYLRLNANTIFLNKEIIRGTFQGFIEKIYKNIGDEVNPGDILFKVKTRESAASDSMQIKLGENLFLGSVLIKAKTKGILTELNYHEGDFFSEGEQLAIVSNPSSLRIKLNVPFENISKIRIGNKCEIDLPGGGKLTGLIEKNVPVVDPNTQTQTYLVKLLNQKELPENLNIIVKIPFNSYENAIVLPKNSVMTNVTQDSFWIMKMLNDSIAIRVDINKGIETDSLVQILSPILGKSDRIISSGSYGLPDTAKVEIIK
jgi:hypothetical protein